MESVGYPLRELYNRRCLLSLKTGLIRPSNYTISHATLRPSPLSLWLSRYRSIPVVTRVYLTLACLTSGAVTFEFVTPLNLYLNYRLIWQKYQIWRLLTNFLFFDRITIHLFFHMHFLYAPSRMSD